MLAGLIKSAPASINSNQHTETIKLFSFVLGALETFETLGFQHAHVTTGGILFWQLWINGHFNCLQQVEKLVSGQAIVRAGTSFG